MAFQVNAIELDQVEIANWSFRPHDTSLDLRTNYQGQITHTMIARVLGMADWSALELLRGQLVSLTTTNHEDRNNPALRIYPNARMTKLSGKHNALHMQDIEIVFRVIV